MAVWNVIYLSDVRSGFRIDSEFYRTEYIEKDHELFKIKNLSIGHLAKVTDGEHGSVSFVPNGVKYLTAEHVKQGYIDADGARFVSDDVDKRNARARVRKGDVLISIKGTLGEVGLAEDSLLPANMNRDVAIIKPFPNSPTGEYITTFLRSKFGEYQLAREGSGGVQQMITLARLRNVRVAVIDAPGEIEVTEIYQLGLQCRQESIGLYTQAQQLLDVGLGLNKLTFTRPGGYTAKFSTVGLSATFNAGRIDAQCFAPTALFYEDWLGKHAGCDRLAHLLQNTAKGRQQTEVDSGSTDYCSIKHISGRELTGASKCHSTIDTPLAIPNDLLLAITGATIGKVGIVKRYEQLAFSGDLLCLRTSPEINPHYLLLVLDHQLGQVQFNRWITGSTNGHLGPRDVGRVLIPRLKDEIESRIAVLVEESLAKCIESERLLHQAKARVEQLIEEAVAS